jgi:sec-independent protein translocase protein TatB
VDNFFGVGSTELLLIIAIATIVLGPRQMAKAALELGKLIRNLRNYSQDFFRVLNLELGDLEAAPTSIDSDSSPPEAAQPVQSESIPENSLKPPAFASAASTLAGDDAGSSFQAASEPAPVASEPDVEKSEADQGGP